MSTIKEGSKTTEFQATNHAKWIGIIMAIIGIVETFAQQSDNKYAGLALALVGVVTATLTALGYNKGRANVKVAAEIAKADAYVTGKDE